MTVKELNIIEFGGLAECRYELSDGLNIFEGENEAGKSTLWLFIKFMLYGMPKKGHPERERAVSRSSHRAAGTMTVGFRGEDYRIERSFSENARGRVTTYRLSDGEKVFVGEEPGEAMLSVPRDIFENSVAIGQGACAGLGGEKGAAAIRNILSSADESVDIEKIQKKLSAVRVAYRHTNGKGGKLYELSGKINSLESRLTEAVNSRLKINETQEKLTRNEENIGKTEALLENARQTVERLGRQEILRRFDSLAENKGKLSRLAEEREKLIEKEVRQGHIPTAAEGAALKAAIIGCERAEETLKKAEKRLSEASKLAFTEEQLSLAEKGDRIEKEGGAQALLSSVKATEKKKRIGWVLVAVGAVLLSLTLWNPLILVGVPVGGALVTVGVILALKNAKKRKAGIFGEIPKGDEAKPFVATCVEAYEERISRETAENNAKAEKTRAEETLEYFKKELAAAMSRAGSPLSVTLPNARDEAERIDSFVNKYGELCRSIESIGEYVKRDERLLSVYNEAELRESVSASPTPEISMKEAEAQRRFHSERLQILRERDSDLKTELINLKAKCEDPDALGDELAARKSEYAEAEKIYEAVLTAMEGIETAASVMRGSITPSIGRNAAELIRGMTDGRYKDVNMDRTLELELVDGNGLTTTSDMMSGGMKDAAYLALRIALMGNIFGDEKPPLMMDEALCQLDEGRTKTALRMLSRLGDEGVQILLFTCHGRERKICEKEGIGAKITQMSRICG